MNPQEHHNFFLEIAGAIHKLTVSAKAKGKFNARMKKFVKMFLDWSAAMEKAQKEADAEPRLRNQKAGPPGYIWDYYSGFWKYKDCPPNPMNLFWNRGLSSEQRELTLDEILTCDYFRLAVIHDGILQGQRHIYFKCTEDVWTDDTGASGPIPTEAKGLWKEISEWAQDKETVWFPGLRAQIENALSDVEADLVAGTFPAEEEEQTSGHKEQKLTAESKALALLSQHPDWSDSRIAKEAGIHRTNLYRMKTFMAVRELQKKEGKKNMPRGNKDAKTGDLEAWEK